MFKRKNRVIRYGTDVTAYEGFLPSRTLIPDWYKKTTKHAKGYNPNRIPLSTSFKGCTPFLEALSMGYMLTTPIDIAVDNSGSDTVITWNPEANVLPIDVRPENVVELNKLLPTPVGFSAQHFVWTTHITFSVPEGYSALVTHPLNRFDLPFYTLSGVIDGKMIMHFGNIPVFFNREFNGIIPRGTPFAQVLPFKREDWDSKSDPSILKEERVNQALTRGIANGWYKTTHWRRKTYN